MSGEPRPPQPPTSLFELLWYIKRYEASIFVRVMERGRWFTQPLATLSPFKWAYEVARFVRQFGKSGWIPSRIREPDEIARDDKEKTNGEVSEKAGDR